jgi:hypothetical protein
MLRFVAVALSSMLFVTACGVSQPERLSVSRQAVCSSPPCNDDSNCGADGYACKNGRTCTDGACLPAWQPIDSTGAPAGRYAASAIEFEGKYVITGGCTADNAYDAAASIDAYAYDPSNDTWTQLADLNEGRAYHNSSNVEAGTFVYGGLTTCNETTSADLGFEKLASLSDTSWSTIPRNWTAGYNVSAWRTDTDEVTMIDGGDTTGTILETRVGSPNSYGSWSDQYCHLGSIYVPYRSPFDQAGRHYPVTFVEKDENNYSIVRILGGDPYYGAAATDSMTFNTVTHQWTDEAHDSSMPDYSDYIHDTYTSYEPNIPIGPREADDGQRVYVMGNSGEIFIYDRIGVSWSTETPSLPSGFCPEGPIAWVDGELIQFSGICSGSIASGGFRYQPPAPQN